MVPDTFIFSEANRWLANRSAMVPDSLFTLNGHEKIQFSDTSGSG